MKTHVLADALIQLGNILKQSPNTELADWPKNGGPDKQKLSVGLTLLLQLAKINKSEWLDFIKEHQFPVAVSTRDSSRNILGKLLKYLHDHPEAQSKIKISSDKSSGTSPELLRTLKALMGE
jgi:hypothetical protein